jgi:ferredoxin
MRSESIGTVQCIYFSPTGSTRKIVETIAAGTGLRQLPSIDITMPSQRAQWSGETDGDLLILGVPVYAGTFPALVREPLTRLSGDNAWAVPIAVCGNVRMGNCVAELSVLLRKQGFRIPAAGTFIAQHSFACDEFAIAQGRPDREDLETAAAFGADIAARIKRNVSDITCLYRDSLYIRMYTAGRIDAVGFTGLNPQHRARIRVSDHNEERCERCGKCAEVCPTGSVNVETYHIDDETCIRCFACTTVCASGAKEKVVQPDEELAAWFTHRVSERGQPLLFT